MSFQPVLEFAGLSDTGLVRAQNEDAIEICAESGFAVLADGMGGYNAGEVASKMCVELISQQLQKKQKSAWLPVFTKHISIGAKWLTDAITLANTRVLAAAHELAVGVEAEGDVGKAGRVHPGIAAVLTRHPQHFYAFLVFDVDA